MICLVSVPPDVDPYTIKLGWLNEDDFIADDSRIITDTSNDYINGYLVTIIRFDPLYEEDEGEYICYAVINGSFISELINLRNFRST